MIPKTFFIFLLLTFSTSHSQHQVKKGLVVANASNLETITSINIENYQGVPIVVERDTRLWFLGRRKMMSKEVLSKLKVQAPKKKAHCMIIEECNPNHIVKGEGILNVKDKLSKRNNDGYEKVNKYGFVPMNADYHYPRSHPPKNN